MKKHTIGVFAQREDAEKVINHIHNELSVSNDQISYMYRNTENEIKEVEADDISSNTPREGAEKGAKTGAVIGALAGIAAVAGIVPVVGPLFAAGPVLTALGIGGAVGTTAAGAVGGAAVGGIIGALANLGVGKERAKQYEDDVMSGNVIVMVHADDDMPVETAMREHGAMNVETYTVNV